MIYRITGLSQKDAEKLLGKALPTLKNAGAPTDMNTVETVPAENISVLDADGKPVNAGKVVLEIPAFDGLRKGDLQALVTNLAKELGVPVTTRDARVLAGFP